jgi:stage II sporulation protein AA (anti-sigma F factor antagonist)
MGPTPSGPGFEVIAGGGYLRLVGELDIAGLPTLQASLDEAAGGDIFLDCSDLTFIDCAGLGALIAAHKRCAGAGLQLTLVAPSRCLVRLFKLARVDGLFQIRAAVPGVVGDSAS